MASKTTNTARLTKVFHELDRNRDGALSLEEFSRRRSINNLNRISHDLGARFGVIAACRCAAVAQAAAQRRRRRAAAHRPSSFRAARKRRTATALGISRGTSAAALHFCSWKSWLRPPRHSPRPCAFPKKPFSQSLVTSTRTAMALSLRVNYLPSSATDATILRRTMQRF